jgi:hypothetical protein
MRYFSVSKYISFAVEADSDNKGNKREISWSSFLRIGARIQIRGYLIRIPIN